METRKERLARLRTKIQVERQATIEDLARFFKVSTATIRRDIKALETETPVIQTVGGGVLYQTEHSGAIDPRAGSHAIQEKIRIAEFCTELVGDKDDILIGPGSTTFLTGKILSGITDRSFRIVTNSLELAIEASVAPNIRTVILGGEIFNRHSVYPDPHFEYFAGCHRNHMLIMSADGIDLDVGITTFETRLVETIQRMISVSDRIVLAADSSKFGRVTYNRICGLEAISTIVTDHKIDDAIVDRLEAYGCRVEIV